MKWTLLRQALRRWEGQSGPPDIVSSNENAGKQDTQTLEDKEYQRANEEISLAHAEVARLRAQYDALAESIRKAQWRFQNSLRALHALKRRRGV